MKRLFAALLLVSCASAPPAPPQKAINELPSAAVDLLCGQLHAEGMSSEIRVVKETQAIVTPASLRALAEISFHSGSVKPELIQAILLTPLIPVAVPAKTCVTRFITPAEAARANDVMVVQFSSPFVNPFGRGQSSGTLARLSLGGEASTWYWIPLAYRSDQWVAGMPMSLSVIE